MNTENILHDIVLRYTLEDIRVGGYLDRDGGLCVFHPIYSTLYLIFDEVNVKITSVKSGDSIDIEIFENLGPDFDVDEDDEYCVFSLWEQVIDVPYVSYKTKKISIVSDDEGEGVQLLVMAIQGDGCLDREIINFDPLNTFGFRIIKGEYYKDWARSNEIDKTLKDVAVSVGM